MKRSTSAETAARFLAATGDPGRRGKYRRRAPRGESRTINLASGGTVTLTVSGIMRMTARERAILFSVLDRIDAYEASLGRRDER